MSLRPCNSRATSGGDQAPRAGSHGHRREQEEPPSSGVARPSKLVMPVRSRSPAPTSPLQVRGPRPMALDRSLGARFGPTELPHAEGTDRHALIQQAHPAGDVPASGQERSLAAPAAGVQPGWGGTRSRSRAAAGSVPRGRRLSDRPSSRGGRGLDGDDVLLLECQILLQAAGVDGVEPKPARRAQVGRDTRPADGLSTPCVCTFRVWRAKVSLGSGQLLRDGPPAIKTSRGAASR